MTSFGRSLLLLLLLSPMLLFALAAAASAASATVSSDIGELSSRKASVGDGGAVPLVVLDKDDAEDLLVGDDADDLQTYDQAADSGEQPVGVVGDKRAAATGGCPVGRLRRVGRRLSRAELRRLLGRLLIKDHHVFHTAGGRRRRRSQWGRFKKRSGAGRLCRYGKRGRQWQLACGPYYKRLRGRPYAYHYPIMNILGGALG